MANAARAVPITVVPSQEQRHEQFMRRSSNQLRKMDAELIQALPELQDLAELDIGVKRDVWKPCEHIDGYRRIAVVEQFISGMKFQYARDLDTVFDDLRASLTGFEELFARSHKRKWSGNIITNVKSDQSLPDLVAPFLIKKEQGIPEGMSDTWIAKNIRFVELINPEDTDSIPGEHFAKLERDVTVAIRRGTKTEELAKIIRKLDGVTRRRAEVIARDQMTSHNSLMTQVRHKQIGGTHYFWRTVGDGRVRERHRARRDKEYAYDAPPSDTPDDGHAGEPIQCRCWPNLNINRILE